VTGSPPPRLLGVHQVAAYLGLPHWTLRELAWRGELLEVCLGRRLLFDRKALDTLSFADSPLGFPLPVGRSSTEKW